MSRSGNRRAGFTLLELIVATAIMGIAVIGLLSLVTQSLRNAAQVHQYDRAAMLARSQMNELLSLEPVPFGQTLAGQFDDSSGWTAEFEPYEVPGGSVRTGTEVLARVALSIWWSADGERKQIELEGFRRAEVGENSLLVETARRRF